MLLRGNAVCDALRHGAQERSHMNSHEGPCNPVLAHQAGVFQDSLRLYFLFHFIPKSESVFVGRVSLSGKAQIT